MNQDTPSRGGEFYKSIIESTDAAQFLTGLINPASPTIEDAWLDFKSGQIPDEHLKRVWSKALGAMANTEGGVLVWGIYARKNSTTKVDAAESLLLVPNIDQFMTRLRELQRTVTDPPVLGVEIKAVPVSGRQGFVVCHIPRSRFKPHRSEAAEKRFYVRIQDHSEEPSVSWLRRMFEPELSPDFALTIGAKISELPDGKLKEHFYATLLNEGNGTAYEAVILVDAKPSVIWNPRYADLVYQDQNQRPAYRLQLPLHPGEKRSLIQAIGSNPDSETSFNFEIFARNQAPLVGAVKFSVDDKEYEHILNVPLSRKP